jgi:hypothetical protein
MFFNRAKILSVWAIVLFAAGCRADKTASAVDSSKAAELPAPSSPARPVDTGWREMEAGPVMLLASGDNSGLASVVIPTMTDSILAHATALNADSVTGMSFDLLDRTGTTGSARLSGRAPSATEGCIAWPVMSLEKQNAQTWEVGFRKGLVTPLQLDSLEGLSSADSVTVTTELARLASALPASNDAAFQGLPFSVRKAYRTTLGQSSFLIGDIVRKINEEANPREERLLLIAERAPTSTSRYETVFHDRATGSEEIVRTSEILAAVRFVNGGKAAIVASYEYENGSRVVLIERTSPQQWQVTWRSAYAGC